MTMARKQNGGFNKFLNFIGLVDDNHGQDNRAETYNSENYGRPSTYVPPRQRTGDSRRTQPTRSLPAQGGRSNYGSTRRGYDGEDSVRYNANRRGARFEEDYDYDRDYDRDYDASRASRPRSRFEEDEETVQEALVPQSRPAPRSNANNRTVMFSLKTLRDANQVITALVKGNTIVMTLDTDDAHLTERIVDTLSGAVFALGATIRKASSKTYLLAPRSVNVKAAYEVEDQF